MPLTDAGYEVLTFDEIRAEIEAEWKDTVSPLLNTRPDSRVGLLIDLQTRRELSLRQEIQLTYSSAYLEASGVNLDRVVGNTGNQRVGAVKSSGTMKFTGNGVATTVPAGKRFSVDGTEKVFTNLTSVALPALSPFEALGAVKAEEFGPVVATTSDTFTIITPVANLVSVVMNADADLGRLLETDTELRSRQQTSTQSTGGGTTAAIRDRLLEITGVTYAAVIPNDLNISVIVFGIAGTQPPHSILPVVEGGADQDIWDAVLKYKGGGIETHGEEVGTAVDALGESRVARFHRVVDRDIKVEITFSKIAEEYPGDTALTNAAVGFVAALQIGEDVILHKFEAHITNNIGGLVTLSMRIANLAEAFSTSNISVSPVERAELASINVTLIEV